MRVARNEAAATISLGVLLGVSAAVKLGRMSVFQAVVALSGMVPGPIVPLLSWGIATAEAAAAVMLVGSRRWPKARARGLWAAAFLLTAFVAYDMSRMAFGITLPGPYFGLWSALPPLPEAAIAAAALVLTVGLLSRPRDAGVRAGSSPVSATDRS